MQPNGDFSFTIQARPRATHMVDPPSLALTVHSQVMSETVAAYQMARPLAQDLPESIWGAPQGVRDLRSLVGPRKKHHEK